MILYQITPSIWLDWHFISGYLLEYKYKKPLGKDLFVGQGEIVKDFNSENFLLLLIFFFLFSSLFGPQLSISIKKFRHLSCKQLFHMTFKYKHSRWWNLSLYFKTFFFSFIFHCNRHHCSETIIQNSTPQMQVNKHKLITPITDLKFSFRKTGQSSYRYHVSFSVLRRLI